MTIYLRQSTASQEIPLGYFVDSTDGDTEETGLTIANTDIKLWKAGTTTLANKNSGGATHISNGIYYATLDATDTNTLGSLVIFIHVAGALTVKLECVVLDANVYDSLIAASDNLEVDMLQLVGVAQSATDLKDFADAGYDPGTNKVQGVVLTDTTTDVTNDVGVSSLTSAAITDIWETDTLTEEYAADGAAAKPNQLMYALLSALSEFAIAGTTITCKKLDGSTTSMTFTLDDASNPTSRTRAT